MLRHHLNETPPIKEDGDKEAKIAERGPSGTNTQFQGIWLKHSSRAFGTIVMNASITFRFPALGRPCEDDKPPDVADSSLPAASPSDEAVLEQICHGSAEALSVLFRRYARTIRGVAYNVLRDTGEADDLLQDIFLLVHRLCGTFDSSKGSGRFWILQMTYRRAISRRRYLTSRHFYTRLDLDQAANQLGDTPAKSGSLGNPIDAALDRREALQNWLVELSESQRQTLHLFFFEGYTFEEIAAKLGQTIGNARNHYYRGLEKLRKKISAGKLPGKEAV
jgi:RNA polymerase sigma-70 factor (ECF subfamily)